MELSVTKVPYPSLTFDNVLVHNPNDLGNQEIYLEIFGTIYKSIPMPQIPRKSIALNNPLRSKHVVVLKSSIYIKSYQIKQKNINKLELIIDPLKTLKDVVSIHEDEFKDVLKQSMKDHYFYPKQTLIIQVQNNNYIVEVVSQDEGFLSNKTTIDTIISDFHLNLISSSLLKRDLFNSDFSFGKIGIGGLDDQLMSIFRRALSTRAIKPSIIKKLGIKHVKGILLHGPPGTGKTLIARNIGNLLSNVEPKIINGPEVLDKYVGQSEENIRNLFKEAIIDYEKNGQDSQLHIIIFDEIDAICRSRGGSGTRSNVTDSLVNQLLTMIDGIHSLDNIFIIAMTNRKDLLDDALLRSGRIEVHIEIGLPDIQGRQQIFEIHTNKMRGNNMIANDVNIAKLAEITENFSGAEIASVVKLSSASAIHELLANTDKDIKDSDIVVTMAHFTKAISEIIPMFGNLHKSIKNLLPDKFLFLSENYQNTYENLLDFVNKKNRLKSLLLYGGNGSGKSCMMYQIAYEVSIGHAKIIKPMDVINMDDHQRSNYMINIIKDSYLSNESLIIFDDLEVLLNYANLGYHVSFSNILYQTFLTILKTLPDNPDHKLTIVATCGNDKLFEVLGNQFDRNMKLDDLSIDDIKTLAETKDIDIDGINTYPTNIKSLLNL